MRTILTETRISEFIGCLRENRALSREQLSKLSGWSKATVSELVTYLLDKAMIIESDTGVCAARGGRKPVLLSFNPHYRSILSVDIGGTKTIVAVTDLEGTLLKSQTCASTYPSIDTLIDTILLRLEQYYKEYKDMGILGISIGVPGVVNKKTGIAGYIPSFDFYDIDLKSPIEKAFGLPVVVENDVNLTICGEVWKGAGRGYENVVLISIGTGIGGGVFLRNEVYTGMNGNAGEIGEMITDWEKERFFVKRFGALEQWISGYAFKEYAASRKESKDLKELFRLMGDRETTGKRIRQGCEHLGLAIANAVVLLDPDKIILAGSIGYHQYETIFPVLDETLRNVLPVSFYRKDIIGRAFLEPYGVVVGGAWVVRKKFLVPSLLH